MQKLIVSPRAVLPVIGTIGLLAYVTAPRWLPITIVERFDFVALGFAVLIALPWLVACFEEFEFGGLKAKFRSVEQRTEEANEKAYNTREIFDELAISRGTTERGQQRPKLSETPEASAVTDKDVVESIDGLRELSRRYVAIRESMSPGASRTVKMTEIFGLLEGLAKNIPEEKGDIVNWLSDNDAGYQIAAIAWLRSHPESIKPAILIETIEQSSQPFVQYWALRVLHGHVDRKGITDFTPRDLRNLQQLEEQMHQKTDRWYQLNRINRKLTNGY